MDRADTTTPLAAEAVVVGRESGSRRRTRSHFLRAGLAAVGGVAGAGAVGGTLLRVAAQDAEPAPAVDAPADGGAQDGATAPEPPPAPVNLAPTPAQTEGPYFKAGSPLRTSLVEPGMTGQHMTLTGRVLTTAGAPVAGAKLDFWQADDRGAYDNAGYRLRGYQLTDADGAYQLETVLPGLYPGRTRHIHFKAQAPGGRVLTSQLYVPNEPGNTRDGIFDARLLVTVQEQTPERVVATYDAVLAA
jgi:protocatechuate 3,4-dioxygenase beta subunit